MDTVEALSVLDELEAGSKAFSALLDRASDAAEWLAAVGCEGATDLLDDIALVGNVECLAEDVEDIRLSGGEIGAYLYHHKVKRDGLAVAAVVKELVDNLEGPEDFEGIEALHRYASAV